MFIDVDHASGWLGPDTLKNKKASGFEAMGARNIPLIFLPMEGASDRYSYECWSDLLFPIL